MPEVPIFNPKTESKASNRSKVRDYGEILRGSARRANLVMGRVLINVGTKAGAKTRQYLDAAKPEPSAGLRLGQTYAVISMFFILPIEFAVIPVIYQIITSMTGSFGTGVVQTIIGGLVPIIMLVVMVATAYFDYYWVRSGGKGLFMR